ncbi:MAG: dipeptide transporter permease DppC [Chloroflexi bacterium]|nr:dipeptide transporter permease DppC [Chloroflexota bacterium]
MGLRYDLFVSMASVVAAAVLGVLVGALAGSAPEWLDTLVMRLVDIIASFPSFILAIIISVALGGSIGTLIFSIALVLLPLHARGTRAAMLTERSKPYADAARAMAIPPVRIVLVHLLPNSLRPTITQMAIDMSNAIMITAALSFLGFGIQSPIPEWGLMVNEGASYIVNGQWWVTFFPGLAILSVVLALFFIDLGLKEIRGDA